MLDLTVLSSFKPRYEKTGKKNLRCFPVCTAKGHQTSGFCGSSIAVQIGNVSYLQGLENWCAWGELCLMKSLQEENTEEVVDLSIFESDERTKDTVSNRYLRGKLISENIVLFKEGRFSWHYDWQSSKNTCEEEHVFLIRFFEQEDRTLKSIGTVCSPSFKLYSRHRVRKHRRLQKDASNRALPEIPRYDANFQEKVNKDVKKSRTEENLHLNFQNQAPFQTLLHHLHAGQAQSKIQQLTPNTNTNITINNNYPPQLPILTYKNENLAKSPLMMPQNIQSLSSMSVPRSLDSQTSLSSSNFHLSHYSHFDLGYIYKAEGLNEGQKLVLLRLILLAILYANGDSDDKDDDVFSSMTEILPEVSNFSDDLSDDFFDAFWPEDTYDVLFDPPDLEPTTGSASFSSLEEHINTIEPHIQDEKTQDPYKTRINSMLKALRNKGSIHCRNNADKILKIIEDAGNYFVKEREVSNAISILFKTWCVDPSYLNVVTGSILGSDMAQKLTADEIECLMYTDTVKFNGILRKFMSLENEIFALVAATILPLIEKAELTLEDLKEPMDICAQNKFLPFDPQYKSEPIIVKLVRLQIYGHVQPSNPLQESEQESINDQEWTELLKANFSHIVRNAIITRVKEIKLFSQLPPNPTPLHCTGMGQGVDFSCLQFLQGVWDFRAESGLSIYQEASKIKGQVISSLSQLTGQKTAGNLFPNLFVSMFKKLEVSISHEAILLKGQKKLFTSGSFLFNLDAVPRAYVTPSAIPCHTTASSGLWVSSWLSKRYPSEMEPQVSSLRAQDSIVRIVVGGKWCRRKKSNSKRHKLTQVESRVLISVMLSNDLATLIFRWSGLKFKESGLEKAPSMEDKAGLDALFKDISEGKSKSHSFTFTRGTQHVNRF
eukprot:augustus_masked-scaffold_2-processed-gene-23.12-mRNA-1 protein AED:1.00 eAED:1.00 QI:0/-1/0/0/-1/1/1/0/887